MNKVFCQAQGDRCTGCKHYHGMADICEHAPKGFQLVGYVIVANDGSVGNTIAPIGWSTFNNQWLELVNDPWVQSGVACAVPVYIKERPVFENKPCTGTNCKSTDGTSHSKECELEHDQVVALSDALDWAKQHTKQRFL